MGGEHKGERMVKLTRHLGVVAALLVLNSSGASAANSGYPGYMPWQAPPGQRNYAPPNQRSTGTPSQSPSQRAYPQGYGYPQAWPGYAQPYNQSPYTQTPYYSPSPKPPKLKLRLSNQSPFVQENLLLHLQLISDNNLKTAVPQLPQSDSLLFQKLEGPTTSAIKQGGKQRIVNKFIYQLTPLREGILEIPPIGVTGTFDGRSSKQEFNVKSAQPLTLQVKPSDPSSTPWLPLETLSLKAKLPPNLRAAAGQPLRLTIEMRAVGSSGSQLPSLEKQLQSPAFRIYREQNRSETKLLKKSDKIIGSRTESFTLVPQYGGELTLPPLRVAWWNIKTGSAQYASVPLTPISVSGGLRGEGTFDFNESSTLFPAGSPAAFWIPLGIVLGVIFGYWLAVWIANRKQKAQPALPASPFSSALKRPFKGMVPAFAPLGEQFRSTTACLNPILRWQRLRRRLIGILPLSLRFWFCVRCVDQENSPDVWGHTLRFLANKHMQLPPRAPFANIAERIIEFQPHSNPEQVRRLIHQLDQSIYGHSDLDFQQWKRAFKQEIRPRLFRFRQRHTARQRKAALPALNPESAV